MRNRIAVLLLLLAACKKSTTEGSVVAQITGGDTVIGASYESVCALYVVLPPDDMDNPQDPIYCAGTLVAPDIVLTAASCVEENVTAGTVADIEVRCGADVDELFAVTDIKLHRYYTRETGSIDDLALVRMDGASTSPVAVLNERPLTAADTGPSDPADCAEANGGIAVEGCAALVGFGETDNNAEDWGARRGTNVPVRAVDSHSLLAGSMTQTGCAGDTGAALFMDFGDGPVLVGVSSSNRNSCSNNVPRTRVDPYLADFVYAYVDRFNVTCGLDDTCEASGCPRSPDPDCDPCAWNEACEEDCPTRDVDCELGSFVGDACADSGDCERGGRCVTAHDDATFTYCSQPCDPDDAGSCLAGMVCGDAGEGDECSWDPALPSPGRRAPPAAPPSTAAPASARKNSASPSATRPPPTPAPRTSPTRTSPTPASPAPSSPAPTSASAASSAAAAASAPPPAAPPPGPPGSSSP
jgi:hypothetical protein